VEWYLASRTTDAECSKPATLQDGTVVYRATTPIATQRDVARTAIVTNESTGRPLLVAWLTPEAAATLGSNVPKGTQRMILTCLDGAPTTAVDVMGGSGTLLVANATRGDAAARAHLEKIAADISKSSGHLAPQ
jgi:hypothetical protein